MDQIKIGKFIAEMRKEQNLTQIDLADALGISNKTISKWECGNGMPDYSMIDELCEILKINVNELLSGERLPVNDYNKKAEENMIDLLQESTEKKKRERKEVVKCILGIIALWLIVFYMIIAVSGVAAWAFFVDVPSILIVSLAPSVILWMTNQWKDFWKSFVCMYKLNRNTRQIKKSLNAMKTVITSFLLSGSLKMVIDFALILRIADSSDSEMIRIHFLIALLPMFYALFYSLCLTPIYIRLKSKLIEE